MLYRQVARTIDVFFVIAGSLLAHWMRFSLPIELTDTQRLLMAFNCALVLLLFPTFGVYETWRGKALPPLLGRVALAWLVVAASGLLLVYTLHRVDMVSRLWFGYSTLISGVLIVVTKFGAHLFLRAARRRGLNFRTVAIVGAPGFTHTLLAHLECEPQAGFKPVMLFDTQAEAWATAPDHNSRLPTLYDLEAFAKRVREENINEVWLALPLSEERTIYRFTRTFRHDFVNLRFVPDVRSLSLLNNALTDVLGIAMINLNASPISPLQMWPKLIFDRLFALCALVLLSPLFAVLAVAIRTTSPGPVFFTQRRMGVDGQTFSIYKFRSMTVNHDPHGGVVQATRGDARVTKLGAFLRRTSLDELPQFFNVLLGQMSVVGPRPHAIEHDDIYKDLVSGYMYRYRIKPGITGWAQVNGYRGNTTKVEKMETRVKFDLFYINNWSFWFDIRIVLITVLRGFVGRNAY